MKAHRDLPDRLKAAGRGLGEASQTDIERRAAELAQIDGRNASTDQDLARAAAELSPTSNDGGHGHEAVGDQGKRTERARLENDSNLGEQLTEQGVAEADHDQRLASTEDETGT
jgi:hypothetical protein